MWNLQVSLMIQMEAKPYVDTDLNTNFASYWNYHRMILTPGFISQATIQANSPDFSKESTMNPSLRTKCFKSETYKAKKKGPKYIQERV